MGTWGTSLYENDTTSDVRDAYMDFLREQLSNEESLEKTLAKFHDLMRDEDEEPLVWFALAETQWKVGRLTKEVKDIALDWIAKGGGMKLWEDSGTGFEEWMKTLDKLKQTLESPMCSEKKIRKPKTVNKSFWNVGDVYAYQFHKEESRAGGLLGKYIMIQKVGEEQINLEWGEKYIDLQPLLMRIQIFDRLFDELPTLEDMVGTRLLPLAQGYMEILPMTSLIDYRKKSEYPADYLHYLGNTSITKSVILKPEGNPILWIGIEDTFDYFSTLWQGKEYEILEDGSFRRMTNN